jgi:hypothetical protein
LAEVITRLLRGCGEGAGRDGGQLGGGIHGRLPPLQE